MAKKTIKERIVKRQPINLRASINQWQSALEFAQSIRRPRKYYLMEVYKLAMDDMHLTSQIDKRLLLLLGSQFHLIKDDGSEAEESTLIQTKWMHEMIKQYFLSLLFGYSVLEITKFDKSNLIEEIYSIDRRYLVVEEKSFLPSLTTNDHLVPYDSREYEKWIFEMNTGGLGWLNKITPIAFYKRFGAGALSEYVDRYGMPMRIAKTDTDSSANLDRVEKMLKNMASNSYGVIDKDEEILFVERKDNDAQVYETLIDYCNSEISKIITGAVVGEKDNSGSRAKEQVGDNILKTLVQGDKQNFTSWFNKYAKPKLVNLGYPIGNLTFEFIESIDIKPLWDRTKEALPYYEMDIDWLNKTFGLEITKEKDLSKVDENKNNQNLGDFFV